MALSTISTISSNMTIRTNTIEPYIRQTVTESGTNVSWHSSCISHDGSILYAGCAYNSRFLYKYDSSLGWVKVEIATPTSPTDLTTIQPWRFMACDNSGTKLIACLASNYVYLSDDSGINWTLQNITGGTADWTGVACDSTGNTLLVCGNASGTLYLSTNRGGTWERVANSNGWRAVAVSKNGQHMVAMRGTYMIESHNYGFSWTETYITSLTHYSCCIANNGNFFIGGTGSAFSRYTYNSSTGVSTRTNIGTGPLAGPTYSMACSADGTRVIVANDANNTQGRVVISLNSGGSWTNYQTPINTQFGSIVGWKTCAVSGDGKKFIVGQGNNNGNIVIITIP